MINPLNGQVNLTKNSLQLEKAKANLERAERFQNTLKTELKKPSGKSKKELMDVCYQFESLMINQMFKAMRGTIDKKNSLLYGGQAEDIFDDMLQSERSLTTAKTAGFGLAEQIYEQMTSKTVKVSKTISE